MLAKSNKLVASEQTIIIPIAVFVLKTSLTLDEIERDFLKLVS